MSGGAMERRRYLGLVDEAIVEGRAAADGYESVAALIGRTLAIEGGVTPGG